MADGKKGMLSRYRALDLTDQKGYLSGRILADLGVDVIKVEPPGGDPGRKLGPFYGDVPHPERSLLWFAYNLGKRSITLDSTTAEGREILKRLARNADFVLESSPPNYMEGLGLGYSDLQKVNPKIIFASISPFGQNGPYCNYKGPDLVTAAMGGFMYLTGDSDRAPLNINYPLASVMASIQAALGSLVALHYRKRTNLGQYIDVSAQESVLWFCGNTLANWELNNVITKRAGNFWVRVSQARKTVQRILWPCRDGSIAFMAAAGHAGARSNRALVAWMEDEGMADDFIRSVDWDNFDLTSVEQEFLNRLEEVIGRFFLSHTKEQLDQGAVGKGILLQVITTAKDTFQSQQLAARDFWVNVAHPELETTIKYPGHFAISSESPLVSGQRAPMIGEHNQDIYQNELKLSTSELEDLSKRRII